MLKEMTDIRGFTEEIKEEIRDFLPDGYDGCDVQSIEYFEGKGKRVLALEISREGLKYIPLIPLNEYYMLYCLGAPVDVLAEDMVERYVDTESRLRKKEELDLSYDKIWRYLRVAPVDAKRREDFLGTVLNRPAPCGFALAVYMDMSELGFEGQKAYVTKDMAENWGYNEEMTIRTALINSMRNEPAVLRRPVDMILAYEDSKLVDLFDPAFRINEFDRSLVLTTENGVHGAAAFFYPGVTEKLHRTIGTDYYAVPVSDQCMMIVPDRGERGPIKMLRDVIRESKETGLADEMLADRIMRYSRDGGLTVAVYLDRKPWDRGER